MTQQVPQLFDSVKAVAAEKRARRLGAASFLLARAREDLEDRLSTILRPFENMVDLGTPDGFFLPTLQAMYPSATCLARATLREDEHSAQDFAAEDPAAAYDLIVSGMAMHRLNDVPGQWLRIRRMLRPDGLMMAVFPGGDTLIELRDVLMRAESEVRGAAGLRVFPMMDVRVAGQVLQRAGFALPVIDSDRITVRYADLLALIRDLRAMGATASALRRPGQPGLTRQILMRAAALYAERYADKDGRLRATFELIWVSGWSPAPSQPKPLKPGSAQTRLADALQQIRDQAS